MQKFLTGRYHDQRGVANNGRTHLSVYPFPTFAATALAFGTLIFFAALLLVALSAADAIIGPGGSVWVGFETVCDHLSSI